MINANELRLNNWVQNEKGAKFKVIGITSTEVKVSTVCGFEYESWMSVCDKSFFNPIPLAEDILLKCGFKKNNKQIYLGRNLFWFDWFFEGEIIVSHGSEGESFCLKIKYLHQLQNLFFVLTGQELNVEL